MLSPTSPANRAARVLRAIALGLGGCSFAVFLFVALWRLGFPYELEWMEGAILEHVGRVLKRQSIYAPPDLHFVAYIYNPAYYYLSAVVAAVVGLQLPALRVVSLLATLASFWLVYRIVRDETRDDSGHESGRGGGDWFAGVMASAVFAGTFPVSGGWFDVARVDMVMLATTLAAFFVARGRHRRAPEICAVLAVAAFLTKQTAVLLLPGLAVAMFVTRGFRPTVRLTVITGVLAGLFVLLLQLTSHGWYWYYAFEVPAEHGMDWPRAADFWTKELLYPLPLAAAIGLFSFVPPESRPGQRLFLGSFVVSLVGVAYLMRLHAGSYLNDSILAHAAVAILFGVGLARLRGALARREAGAGRPFTLVVPVLACLQLVLLRYDPRPWVPGPADRAEGDRLVAHLRSVPGDVLLGYRSHLPTLAGKASYACQMAMGDMLRVAADRDDGKARLRAQFIRALDQRRFQEIILDNDDYLFMPEVLRNYRPAPTPFITDPSAFWTPTGSPMKPRLRFLPK